MDGTTAGNGLGPRTMVPVAKNVLLASEDSVAIDAVFATLMGFDPMDHLFIRRAHERGLGTGRIEEIEIVGDVDLAKENWHFHTGNNGASSVGKLFWFGPLKFMQKLLFHTPIVYNFIFASAVYHDKLWYPSKGKAVVKEWLKTAPGDNFLIVINLETKDASVISSDRRYSRFVSGDLYFEKRLLTPAPIEEM